MFSKEVKFFLFMTLSLNFSLYILLETPRQYLVGSNRKQKAGIKAKYPLAPALHPL